MKRRFYLLSALLSITFILPASSLHLRFNNPGPYNIHIDGIYYPINGSNLFVHSIQPGNHAITIESILYPVNRRHHPVKRVVYRGTVYIQQLSDVFVAFDGCGLRIEKVIRRGVYPNHRHYHYKYNYDLQNYEPYDDESGGWSGDIGYDSKNYDDQWNERNKIMNQVMNPQQFERYCREISDLKFENSRRDKAINGLSNNMLSVDQVKQIIPMFSFENTKLEFAKFAYNRCIDTERFGELTDLFAYENNKNEIRKLKR